MKVLAIQGSPRLNGNTATLLQEVINGAKSKGAYVELIHASQLNIRPCTGCEGCNSTGNCGIVDDMHGLYEKLDTYDRLIIASPIYFFNVTAQLKMIIDRCQVYWARRFKLNERDETQSQRKALFLATAGAKDKGYLFESTLTVAKVFFSAVSYQYSDSILVDKTDQFEVSKNKTLLRQAFEAGQELTNGSG